MAWLTPPPLIDKPLPPVLNLPIPKRKGLAVLIVLVPTVICLLIGYISSFVFPPLGRALSGRMGEILQMTLVRYLWIAWFGFFGLYVGIRSLLVTLVYGALERDGKIPKEISEESL
ncbi:MAG TPA: hypothetical protein VN397_00120 [Candidatus Methylomirabilis sp.]|nr:hypothetical protein [Candidatus Methylomirabilis sp.]